MSGGSGTGLPIIPVDENAPAIMPSAVFFESGIFDMGYRGQKTIQFTDWSIYGITNAETRILSSFDNGQNWLEYDWVPLNDEGMAFISAAGVDFKFQFRGTAGAGAKIDYVTVRYKATDRRLLRGLQANVDQTTADAGI